MVSKGRCEDSVYFKDLFITSTIIYIYIYIYIYIHIYIYIYIYLYINIAELVLDQYRPVVFFWKV